MSASRTASPVSRVAAWWGRSAVRFRLAAGLLAGAGALLGSEAARACAVCYGGAADHPMISGTRLSILFLLVLTYLLLGGGIAFFVFARRRRSRSHDKGLP